MVMIISLGVEVFGGAMNLFFIKRFHCAYAVSCCRGIPKYSLCVLGLMFIDTDNMALSAVESSAAGKVFHFPLVAMIKLGKLQA